MCECVCSFSWWKHEEMFLFNLLVPIAHSRWPAKFWLKLLPNWYLLVHLGQSEPPAVQIGSYCICCGTVCHCSVPADLLLQPAGQRGWLNDHFQGGEWHSASLLDDLHSPHIIWVHRKDKKTHSVTLICAHKLKVEYQRGNKTDIL